MKTLLISIVLVAGCLSDAVAADKPASLESVKELVTVMRSQDQIKDMHAVVGKAIDSAMESATRGKTLSTTETQILNEMRTRMVVVMNDILSWARLEPMMVDVYQKSFTENEIAGMLAFYKTDAGQAVVAKMPNVLANTMQHMQGMMEELRPRLREIQDSTLKQLEAAKSK